MSWKRTAIVVFPGGFGTHDEAFEVLTLLQTGKAPPMPVVLVDLPGEDYWDTWDRFIRKQLLDRQFISPPDLSFYRIMHSAGEASAWIGSFYSIYHSIRQCREQLVIRLNSDLPDAAIERLNQRFPDIVRTGRISRTRPLAEERDEPYTLPNPRISFSYNNRSAGRLNEMILEINRLGAALPADMKE